MISAEHISARFRRFRQIFSKVLFIFHHEKPKPPVVPADDEPDEFQKERLEKVFNKINAAEGPIEAKANVIYVISSVSVDAAKKET